MREPLRFSWRHWWNLVAAMLAVAGVTLWALGLVDGRLALAALLLWLAAGAVAAPSIIQEHTAFADRWIFHDYGKARLRYRRAVDTGKATPQAYCALASLCRAEGDPIEASRLLQEAVVRRPGDPYLLLLMSRNLSALGRHEEAVSAAIRCKETGAPKPLADVALADALRAKGETVAAAAAYQKALQANPKLVDCRVNLAGIYLAMGETQAAEKEVGEALRTSSRHPDALYWAGNVAAAKGELDKARAYYRSALQSRPVDDHSLATPYVDVVRAISRPVAAPVPAARLNPGDAGFPDPPSPGEKVR